MCARTVSPRRSRNPPFWSLSPLVCALWPVSGPFWSLFPIFLMVVCVLWQGLPISTAFSIATRARKKLKDATLKHKFKQKAKLVMLSRGLAKTTSTKAPKPQPANTAPGGKTDTEGPPITGVSSAAAKKFSVASSNSNGFSFLVRNTGISPLPPSVGASPISQLTAARGGGPEQ
jgi:hypothetical protein